MNHWIKLCLYDPVREIPSRRLTSVHTPTFPVTSVLNFYVVCFKEQKSSDDDSWWELNKDLESSSDESYQAKG